MHGPLKVKIIGLVNWRTKHSARCSLPDIDSSCTSAIAAGSSNGLTSARCCRYSCVCSWWWVEIPPETCRAVHTSTKSCTIYLKKNTSQTHAQFKKHARRKDKHVEHFPDINKKCNVVSCWIYIRIYLRCTDSWMLHTNFTLIQWLVTPTYPVLV